MKLIISGEGKKVEALKKELRLKLKRNNLTSELIESESKKDKKVVNLKSVKDTVEEINSILLIEDLERFEADERKSVVKALEAKRQELSESKDDDNLEENEEE